MAFIPARPGFKWTKVTVNNYIDEHIFAKLRTLRMNPSGLCSDEAFARRAYLDLLGILPTAGETRAFVANKRRDKRTRLIERLFERPEFADFWALKWADLLRVEAHSLDPKGVQNFHRWIRQNIAENRPLDQFARDLISARGSTYSSPAANYYRPHRDPAARGKAAGELAAGARIAALQGLAYSLMKIGKAAGAEEAALAALAAHLSRAKAKGMVFGNDRIFPKGKAKGGVTFLETVQAAYVANTCSLAK